MTKRQGFKRGEGAYSHSHSRSFSQSREARPTTRAALERVVERAKFSGEAMSRPVPKSGGSKKIDPL